MLNLLIHQIQLPKEILLFLKAEVDLDINKLINAPNSFKNLKRKVDDLDVDQLKTAPEDLKKITN